MLRAPILRKCLVFGLSFGLAACAAPIASWQKAGVDDATMAKDTSDCCATAHAEAVRLYPYGSNPLVSGTPGALMSQQNDERDRRDAEDRSVAACMVAKGYEHKSSQVK